MQQKERKSAFLALGSCAVYVCSAIFCEPTGGTCTPEGTFAVVRGEIFPVPVFHSFQ